MEKYINPFTDFGFKKLFGEEANQDLLIDFLNTLLADKGVIIALKYLRNEYAGRTEEDRKIILDILCETDAGEKFIVEMQKARQTYIKDRAVYYSTFPIQAQAKKDVQNKKDTTQNYTWDYKLNGVYTIAIMDFTFQDKPSPPEKVKHDVMLMDIEAHSVFYEKLRFIFLEMPHFTKKVEELETHYDKWLFVLKNLSRLEQIPEKLKEKIFMKVFDVADTANYSSNLLAQYQDSLKDYRDLKNTLDTYEAEAKEAKIRGKAEGKAEGKVEGKAEGKAEKAIEIALEAMKEGFSDETIHKIIKLPLAEIAQIRQENGL
jgi:predicted transposase/invertase (TIGR01784 family)